MGLSTISHTAWVVMRCQIALHNDKRWQPLVSDEDKQFYQSCFNYCRRTSPLFWLLSFIPERFHLWLIDNALAVGAPQHFALRKQTIRKQLEECIANGIQQLVVVGGGFDSLAVRTAFHHPAITCFELDMPRMSAHKLRAAGTHYHTIPTNFHGIGKDLGKYSMAELLSSHPAFNRNKPTLFIAEGLTMYLNESGVKQLFDGARSLCENSIGFVFTAIEPVKVAEHGWGKTLRNITLKLSGEHFFWSKLCDEVPAFLREQRFEQKYLVRFAELQRPWRKPEELSILEQQNGEYLVYAVANAA